MPTPDSRCRPTRNWRGQSDPHAGLACGPDQAPVREFAVTSSGQTLADVAVVIPVGPGHREWRELIEVLDRIAPGLNRRLVFVHGDLQSRPRDPDERWTESARGRARQQNAGAAGLDQNWLWFLHADSRPDAAAIQGLTRFVARGKDEIGYFDLRFSDERPALLRLTEAAANWRSHQLGLPFGDQGFLMTQNRFYELGGFDESRSHGEDHALIWQARRTGVPVTRIEATLLTSPRQYQKRGWLLTTLRHQRLTWTQAWQESRSR